MKYFRKLIFSSFITTQLLMQAFGYCFFNQTGSDVATIELYVYEKKADAYAGTGLKLASDLIQGIGSFKAVSEALVFFKPVGKVYDLINKNLFKKQHIISQGEHACWNWRDIGRNSMFFVVIDNNGKDRNKFTALWVNELESYGTYFFCKKNNISLVNSYVGDERCGEAVQYLGEMQ